jgi:hypothetical protein
MDAGEVARIFKAMAREAGLSVSNRHRTDKRPQHPRRRGSGHAALRRNTPHHHAGRTLENRRNGRLLHRETRRPPERRRTGRRPARAVLTQCHGRTVAVFPLVHY